MNKIANLSLEKMKVYNIEIINPNFNYGQVFLWFQEISIFDDALRKDIHPGIKFSASDLLRNLFLSSYMNLSFIEQENIYKIKWINLIENYINDSKEFDKIL